MQDRAAVKVASTVDQRQPARQFLRRAAPVFDLILLVPLDPLAIGLVQTTGWLVPALADQVSAIVLAAVAVFETIGPPIAAFALRLSGDAGRAAPDDGEADAARDGSSGATPPATAPGATPGAVAADSAYKP